MSSDDSTNQCRENYYTLGCWRATFCLLILSSLFLAFIFLTLGLFNVGALSG